VLVYLFRDFDRFIFNNLQYHRLNTIWYRLQGDVSTMSIGSKIYYARGVLSDPSNVSLLICALFTAFAIATKRQWAQTAQVLGARMNIWFSALLVLFGTVIVFMTTPLQNQYFAVPIPFVVLLIVCLYSGIREEGKIYARILFVAVALMSAIFMWPRLFRDRDSICDTSKWTAVSVHNTARNIRQAIGPLNNNESVATLSPLYVMEAGLPILPELATGPFMFRVGDLLPDDKRHSYISSSAKDIHQLFDKTKPKAILAGFEPEWDLPLIEYAKEHGYSLIDKDFQGGILYVREDKEH